MPRYLDPSSGQWAVLRLSEKLLEEQKLQKSPHVIPLIKVGGWVDWCQGVDYPNCPECKIPMTVPLLQLECESEVRGSVVTSIALQLGAVHIYKFIQCLIYRLLPPIPPDSSKLQTVAQLLLG